MQISDTDYHPRILVIDNDAISIRLIAEILTKEDYWVRAAFGGQQALDDVEKYAPDIVLLNATVADYNGFELTRLLKNNPTTENIPVILLTNCIDSEVIEKGFDAGADEFLSSPVNSTELIARVRSVLKIKIYQEQLRIRRKIQSDFADNGIIKNETPTDNESKFDHILLSRENPRLCRGDSSSLTFTGVHQGNSTP